MESKYKDILLQKGLDNITDEDLDKFKYYLPDEFTIPKHKQEAANRIMLATLMIQNAGVESAVMKTINIFKKMNYMQMVKSLQEEKEKVDCEYVGTEKEKETKPIKKKTQAEMSPVASATSTNDVIKQHAVPEVPQIKPGQNPRVAQQESTGEGLQKGPMTVMVLKAMKLVTFQTQKGTQEMFHATVATENEFFFVKVFNTQLIDKFIKKKIIVISDYYRHSGFLEVNSSSHVCDALSDQKVSVPGHISRKAGATPKIDKLQKQSLGTIVNGMFLIQKVIKAKKKTTKKNEQK